MVVSNLDGVELLVEKTPDLAPWLKLAVFPHASISIVVLRHPYYQARCPVRTQGESNQVRACVSQWEEGVKYTLARLRDAEKINDQRWAAVRLGAVLFAAVTFFVPSNF